MVLSWPAIFVIPASHFISDGCPARLQISVEPIERPDENVQRPRRHGDCDLPLRSAPDVLETTSNDACGAIIRSLDENGQRARLFDRHDADLSRGKRIALGCGPRAYVVDEETGG